VTTPIRLLVGLGNPGANYANTRHNAGARLVETCASQCNAQLQTEKRFFSQSARITMAQHDLRLLIPTTYMNRSGQAVAAVANFFRLSAEEILVAHDELDLPAGVARLKRGGGHGGHNGLRSIIQALGNERNFLRLRLGIGHPGNASEVTGHVLSKASVADEKALETAIDLSLQVMPLIVAGNFDAAMNQLHSAPTP
jgi:PTH1 family peptidyl-tRNA hydrolase